MSVMQAVQPDSGYAAGSGVSMYTGAAVRGGYMGGQPDGVRPSGSTGRVETAETSGADRTARTGKTECQTCKKRKYMDRSNEGDVSFQAPTHISPNQAASRVMSHEREHVQNAVSEGQQENKKLVSVSVSLKMAVCPECGRSYVAGGTTRTKMLTYRENPYDQSRKSVEGAALRGMNVDRKL